MYKYVNELLTFCKNHIKNYSIQENFEDNVSVIRFENDKDVFDMVLEGKSVVQKIIVDHKQIEFKENDSVATRINTMFKEIMERVRV